MDIIPILLTLIAIYCGGMWLWYCVHAYRLQSWAKSKSTWYGTDLEKRNGLPAQLDRIELHTFHLGLCFVLAVGFLGVIG